MSRFRRSSVLAALASLCATGGLASVWWIRGEIERLEILASRRPSSLDSGQLADLARRVESLERRADSAARDRAVAPEPSQHPTSAPDAAEPAVSARWKDEARLLWNAVARLEGRTLRNLKCTFTGDGSVDLGDALLEGLALAAESNPAASAWSVEQVLGPPDTEACGDNTHAWASLTQDAPLEWIEVEFADARPPLALIVRETFNPGAVARIEAADARGGWQVLWEGEDPSTECPANLVVQLDGWAGSTAVFRVVIDSAKVAGWNEIDAIGRITAAGGVEWAVTATASSSYASHGSE